MLVAPILILVVFPILIFVVFCGWGAGWWWLAGAGCLVAALITI